MSRNKDFDRKLHVEGQGVVHSIIRAAQGNFDSLREWAQSMTRAHNAMVDDINKIADYLNGVTDTIDEIRGTSSGTGEHGGGTSGGAPSGGGSGSGSGSGYSSPTLILMPGDDGDDGVVGPPGAAGAAGAAGGTGPSGAAGATGPPGPPGNDGDDGDMGIPGPAGPAGATGATGAAGSGEEDNNQSDTSGYPQSFKTTRYHLASDQTLTNATETDITYDTSDWNTLNLSVASGVFTIGEDGLYLIIGHVEFANNTTGNRGVVIQKNGTTKAGNHSTVAAGSEDHGVQAYLMDYFANGDTVKVRAKQSSGGNLAAKSGVNASWVAIIRLKGRRWGRFINSTDQQYSSNAVTRMQTDTQKYNPSQRFIGPDLQDSTFGIGVPDGVTLTCQNYDATSEAAGGMEGMGKIGNSGANSQILAGRFFDTSGYYLQSSSLGLGPYLASSVTTQIGILGSLGGLWYSGAIGGTPKLNAGDTKSAFTLYNLNRLRLFMLVNAFNGGAGTAQSFTSGTTFTVYNPTSVYLSGTHAPSDTFTQSAGAYTIPRTGKWLVFLFFPANSVWINSATGRRAMMIDKNTGTKLVQSIRDGQALANQYDQLAAVVSLSSGDTIDFQLYQNSGSSNSITLAALFLFLE